LLAHLKFPHGKYLASLNIFPIINLARQILQHIIAHQLLETGVV
jgi:hypothetical protein